MTVQYALVRLGAAAFCPVLWLCNTTDEEASLSLLVEDLVKAVSELVNITRI